MRDLIAYSARRHNREILRPNFALCDFMNGYLYFYDSVTEKEHGPFNGRERVHRILNKYFNPYTVILTANDNRAVLDSVGASNFEYHKIEGRDNRLYFVRDDGKRLPINNWSAVLDQTYQYNSNPYGSQGWINNVCDLWEFNDLLLSLGIPWAGSWGALATNAVRATILGRYRFASPGLSPRSYVGARIEEKLAYKAKYDAMKWDIVGAYAWAMSHKPLPITFSEDHHRNTDLAGEGVAEVYIEPRRINLEYAYSPVPTGYRANGKTKWGNNPVRAYFPFSDIRAARDSGSKVSILRTWTAAEFLSPGDASRIMELFYALREHPFGKKVVNSFFGAMISRGDFSVWRYLSDSDKRKTRKIRGRSKKRDGYRLGSYATGSYVAGLVREKLYREALANHPAMFCHTDGVVILDRRSSFRRMGFPNWRDSFSPDGRIGNELGDWKLDGRLRELRFASAQHYRFLDENGETNYIWAGDDWSASEPTLANLDSAIHKLRSSGGFSSFEQLRAVTRNRPENWADRWIVEKGE